MSNIINFYELDTVKKYAIQYDNPNYDFDTMPLKHPMRLLICGCSGSGKSNIILNIINLMDSTFEKIVLFTQDKSEQLYEYLEDVLDDGIEIYEGIHNVNTYDFNNLEEKQYLFIFDDMCIENERDQKNISNLFIRGRKMANQKGCSVVYLTQSYFQVPSVIRKQMTGLILRKINGKKDLGFILKDQTIGARKEQLLEMYNACTDDNDIRNFLYIDLSAPEKYRFRFRFDTILDINNF